MSDRWDRNALVQFGVTTGLLVAVLAFFARFVAIIEKRQGVALRDPVLALLPPRDLGWILFAVVYGGVAVTVVSLARRPHRLMLGMQSYSIMVALRATTIWLVPLDPPQGMIPLEDPVIRFFGPSEVLTRDLFFSGHTASLVVFLLVAPSARLRASFLLGTVVIAACVLVQRVHYSIDVLAAPAFAWVAWKAASFARARLGLPQA